MSDQEPGPQVIQFPAGDGSPKIRTKKRRSRAEIGFCRHTHQLLIDEETQLVECSNCHTQMSAYNALMLIVEEWDRMHYDVTEWRKMREEQAKENKATEVRRMIRHLQWIERPGDDEPDAQRVWDQLKEATGQDPYALHRRGRGKRLQYVVISPQGGWTDAEYAISYAQKVKTMEAKGSTK